MSERATEREARIRERGTTHWEGCWRSHPRCAEARVEKLEARVERYREALEEALVALRRAAGSSILLQDATSGDVDEEALEWLADVRDIPPNEHEKTFAHRALNDGEDDG